MRAATTTKAVQDQRTILQAFSRALAGAATILRPYLRVFCRLTWEMDGQDVIIAMVTSEKSCLKSNPSIDQGPPGRV